MTFREKLEALNPGCNSDDIINSCCPSDFNYSSDRNRNCNYCDCDECWDREIPEEKSESKKAVEIGNALAEGIIDGIEKPLIKDSGARREFETGAVRDIQEGKGRCDLLPLDVKFRLLKYKEMCDPEGIGGVFMDIELFKNTGNINFLFNALSDCCIFGDPFTMFLEVSKHFEEGAKKYGEYNWQKGIPTHCYIDSAVRHYLKYLRGDKDEPHDRAFVWNILCCIWTCIHKPELNDYRKEKENET